MVICSVIRDLLKVMMGCSPCGTGVWRFSLGSSSAKVPAVQGWWELGAVPSADDKG